MCNRAVKQLNILRQIAYVATQLLGCPMFEGSPIEADRTSQQVNNSGTIALNSTGSETLLQLIRDGITLTGGGEVTLSDSAGNLIQGTSTAITLTNVDNVISGAGQLGGGQLTLINEGTIKATGTEALVIDTGASVVKNAGTLEATGEGGLLVTGAVDNTGTLLANGGNITIVGAVTGSGVAEIDGNATLAFGAASSVNVAFDEVGSGTLRLGDSFDFSGLVSGFASDDTLDFNDLAFMEGLSDVSFAASADGSGGTLTVTDGTQTASITLVGTYNADEFGLSKDADGSTLLTYHPDFIV